MAAKDKDNKALDKLKQFFRVSRQNPGNYRSRADYALSKELDRDLGPDSAINDRLRAIRNLCEIVHSHRLEDYGLERIWSQTRDLLDPSVDVEHRHAAFNFMKILAQEQYEKIGMVRVFFFKFIKKHKVSDDVVHCFELLQSITNDGRDIQHLEDEFGSFLSEYLPTIAGAGKVVEYFDFLISSIKYNGAYIEDVEMFNIVQSACFIACYSKDTQAVLASLKVLAAVVTFSQLPSVSLKEFASTLCRKINAADIAQTCWKVMKDLLGTHMGHATIFVLCGFLQDSTLYSDYLLLRGAIFYIHMGLWSEKAVPSLRCTHSSILPSFLQVLDCRQSLVVYEVILCAKRLVDAHGLELHRAAWDILLDIIVKIINYVVEETEIASKLENPESADDLVPVIAVKLQETLTTIEQLIELGQFNGEVERVFNILESCAKIRPESSVLRLINYLAEFIKPSVVDWLGKLDALVDRYYKQETRLNVRIKVIEVISKVLSKHRYLYEEEIVERIILKYLTYVEMESELCVRNAVAQLLIAVCMESDSKKSLDVLGILEKLLNRPFDANVQDQAIEGDILDVKTVAAGLIRLFQVKLDKTPACHASKTYKILMGHLEIHYLHPTKMTFMHGVHLMIFEMILKIRVNILGQIGLMESAGILFSPYLIVDKTSSGSTSSAPPSPSPIPFTLNSTTKILITALGNEKDWRILSLLLLELPNLLQNKVLIADRNGADVGPLCDSICALVLNYNRFNFPETLRNQPPKMNRTEFHSHVFPVIAAISAYHSYLEPNQQVRCIKCLEYGLTSKCAAKCVLAITTCTLEMKDAMYKLLPEVLLNLSKISATKVISIAILEFLSTLTSLPKVFASFVGDQYMSVFAIALPYTNPFKYNHYTVSLAHHVIAVWFLKCRLPFRRDFVKFITNGLKANILLPFEDQMLRSDLASLNEDSTNRKRSSSLTEQGSRRRDRPLPSANPHRLMSSELRHPINEEQMTFHSELTETCIDLMARYTFSSCGARPTRSATAEFLLSGGQDQTWLLGHKLITVTTSGCLQKPLRNNLCERCEVYCRIDREPESPNAEREAMMLKAKSFEEEIEKGLLYAGFAEEPTRPVRDVCTCWCQGWVEVWVRRPTGDMSWIMRLENELHPGAPLDPQSMSDLSALFVVTQPDSKRSSNLDESSEGDVSGSGSQHGGSRKGSRDSVNKDGGDGDDEENESDFDPSNLFPQTQKSQPTPIIGGKSRNPVRRSNSSPEMSASWKNPFLKDKNGMSHEDSPKARVSCEAIPEEMTPPDAPSILTLPPRHDPRDLRLRLEVDKCIRGLPNAGDSGMDEPSALPTIPFTRDRSRTISVMSPIKKSRYELELLKAKTQTPRNKEAPRSGVSPSFVFLQLFHSSYFEQTDERPILISNDAVIQRAINALDSIPPFETHKVGVVYIGPGQCGIEAEILGNEFGSLRYANFLQRLGSLINLRNADPQTMFLGGLDNRSGVDGRFACIWQDDVTQVTFHIATLMPNKESDPNCNAKKLHIGNDYVTIVYNESGEEYKFTKMGQFNYVNVVIQPMDMGSNKVMVKTRPELADFGHAECKIVSDDNLPVLARQLALHANLASEVHRSLESKVSPYASNWLERLRKIKRLRKKALDLEESGGAADPSQPQQQPQQPPPKPEPVKMPKPDHIDDFTEYT